MKIILINVSRPSLTKLPTVTGTISGKTILYMTYEMRSLLKRLNYKVKLV